MRLTRLNLSLIAIILGGGGWLLFQQVGPLSASTPVTAGEGSVLITTHPTYPFFARWKFLDGTMPSDSKMIEHKTSKRWTSIYANSLFKATCEGFKTCVIAETFSEGTTVILSTVTPNGKGMRITSSRVFSDYTRTDTTLSYGDAGITLTKAVLSKPGTMESPVDLCAGVSKCQVLVNYE